MRLPSAPSIPASHQVFGYEEADNGELVMQRNPDKIYTGKGVDTVGPGAYNLSRSLERPNGVDWGRSKQPKKRDGLDENLGPGTYQHVYPQNICRDMAYKKQTSAAFSSTVPRGNFNRKDKQEFKQRGGSTNVISSIQKSRHEESDQEDEDEVDMPGPGQ